MGILRLAVGPHRLTGLVASQVTAEGWLGLHATGLGNPDPLEESLVWLILRHRSAPEVMPLQGASRVV